MDQGEKVEEPRRRFFGNSQVERGGSFKMKPVLVVNLLILGMVREEIEEL